jgi:hypothetical protein
MIRQFVSFPKSGRTWIRYILEQLGHASAIEFHHDRFEFNDGARPAHDFDVASRIERYRQVDKLVYLERDPRDVMVSLYWQVTGRFREFFHYDGSISEFLRDDYFGARNLHRFRAMWAEIIGELGFPIVAYEECHADPAATVRRILSYYGFAVDEGRLADAVRDASFDNMRAVEQSRSFPQPWLMPKGGFPKVREGKVGGHRNALSASDIEYLDSVFGS